MSDFYEGRMIPLKIADAAIISCNKEIEKLQIENARLKSEVDRLAKCEGYHYTAIAISMLKEQLQQKSIDYVEAMKANEAKVEMIKRLKAEVERLTKAGDEMAEALNLNDDVFDNRDKKEAQANWLAAKEGKQP